ncbi:MAG TPA: hypothetical protein DIC18_03695 [Clostridiales bacterium]|nr:hypothetical protein [Clostridiales bacterium]HCU56418.1 hypothetical protein [Clostridiales bacterium]
MDQNNLSQVFANNLRELIRAEGISVNEFSKRVDIPQPTISRYLLCQREITLANLVKIADYFGEDIDVLLGRKTY